MYQTILACRNVNGTRNIPIIRRRNPKLGFGEIRPETKPCYFAISAISTLKNLYPVLLILIRKAIMEAEATPLTVWKVTPSPCHIVLKVNLQMVWGYPCCSVQYPLAPPLKYEVRLP